MRLVSSESYCLVYENLMRYLFLDINTIIEFDPIWPPKFNMAADDSRYYSKMVNLEIEVSYKTESI